MVNVSTLGQYLDQIARLKTQQSNFGDVSAQIASGKKTQKLSGLGADITKTIRSRIGVNSINTYVENIRHAERRIKLMDISLREIKAQAENISGFLTTTVQEGEYPDLATLQSMTKNIYNFVMDAMNQMDGDRYLFGGGDVSEPPITDTGLLKSALGQFVPDESDLTNPPLVASGLFGSWGDGSISTDEFIRQYNSTSDTVLGFSNALTTNTAGKTFVRVNDGSEFDYTTLANKTSMKDLIMVMGVLQQLPPVEYAPGALNDPTATTLPEDVAPFPPAEKQQNFFKVLNDLTATLNKAIDGMDKEISRLSQVHSQINIVKNYHTEQVNAYKDVIGEVEDIDITEASVRITQMQTQIQISYSVTAMLSQLTLANFLK